MNSNTTHDPYVKTIACIKCQAALPVFDPKHSKYFACENCGTFFNVPETDTSLLIGQCDIEKTTLPVIAIGSECRLMGLDFVVTGFARKQNIEDDEEWTEYYLRNAKQLYYYILVEYKGHWLLIWKKDLQEYQLEKGNEIFAKPNYVHEVNTSKVFKFFSNYRFRIYWMAGEFDWNLLEEAEEMDVTEYVYYPNIIVSETFKDKTELFWGEKLNPQVVQSAFNLKSRDMPTIVGKGPLVEAPEVDIFRSVVIFTIFIALLATFATFLIHTFKPTNKVFEKTYTVYQDATNSIQPIVTQNFKISQKGAVAINLYCGLDNDWMMVDLMLVNDNTGKTFEANRVMEHYSGYEGGESWTEASNRPNLVFSAVPKGNYHLNIYPVVETNRTYDLLLSVEENTILESNIILMLLIILLYPALLYLINYEQE